MNMTTQISAFNPKTVKVGDGVTERIGSDSRACTVTYVSPSGKTIRFTHDEYEAKPRSDYYGEQEYEYSSVEEQSYEHPVFGKQSNARKAMWNEERQRFVPVGSKAGLGVGRRTYFDPSF